MDLSQVERLKEEHKKGLQLCEEKIVQWERFKTDYETLKQHLKTLPDALSYDITVPFGPNAFSMGKLVHTNEVMVLLGDNWFAEVSGKQAVAIADRRIAQCLKMLEDLVKEKQQFQNWLTYIDEVSNENLVEIVEEYDEEKEKEWREQHAKHVKAYRQMLAEKKKHSHSSEESIASSIDGVAGSTDGVASSTDGVASSTDGVASSTDGVASSADDEYVTKLEKLELMETPEERELSESEVSTNEFPEQKELSESETIIPKCEDDKSQEVLEKSSKPPLKLDINCANNQDVIHETESCDDDDGSKSDDVNSNLENCSSESNGKHVRWQDLSKQNIKKITFKHSKSKLHTHKHHVRRQDSSESEDSLPLIQSPSDIYKHFGSLFQATSPKSILKVKNSPTTPERDDSFFSVDEIVPKDNSPDVKSENIVNAFTGKVYERSSPIHIPEKKSHRPVSHFKSSRKNKKR